MTFLILSDIHGSAECLETALASFESKVDAIILLGDYLNHGPRNPLPQGWDTKRTAELLNARKEKLICVRGNCDSEVDEMMLTFPCLNAYSTIALPAPNGIRRLFLHHGHLYTHDELSTLLPKGSIVLSGHTHVTELKEEKGLFYFNPGSISLPKCNDGKTCGILEAEKEKVKIGLYSIEGKLIRKNEV
ncbi:phosphodiesterase [uncultured Treponema sp.]|uniref:phosphodiesterase n=1 Tax=uncultured Treponema sp. TaxID=162155 RepID=UPI0025E8628D|nr:phosphodiesterase [uncultured Treponema sp.]